MEDSNNDMALAPSATEEVASSSDFPLQNVVPGVIPARCGGKPIRSNQHGAADANLLRKLMLSASTLEPQSGSWKVSSKRHTQQE